MDRCPSQPQMLLSQAQTAELLSFLSPSARPDVKGQATGFLLGLSGHRDGRQVLGSKPELLAALFALTSDPSIAVAKDCYFILVNLSADQSLHQALLSGADLLPPLLKRLVDPEYAFSDQISTVLSNLSRQEETCRTVLKALQDGVGLPALVEAFCAEGYNKQATLHYLGPLLSNLAQLPEARRELLSQDRCLLQRLLPFTQYEASAVRRGGVVGILRNCCFDHGCHQWLLGDAVDVLPYLLLPLAGPEELTEEENEGLPVDLQYLPEDKKREEDPDIRKMVLETLLLLTATKSGRKTFKEKNVYAIMREFHRWEQELPVRAACERLVQVLVGDEPEPGMENLMEVEIPPHVEEELRKADGEEEEEEELERRPEDGPGAGEQ